MIPQDIIDRILSESDIVKVISDYVTLRKKGANYAAVCPFHADRDASLFVSPGKRIWKCFGCGATGNVISFVEKYEGLSFPDAVRVLAEKLNIEIPKQEYTEEQNAQMKVRESMRISLSYVAQLFESNRASSSTATSFLNNREIPEDILRLYHTGFAVDEFNFIRDTASSAGYSMQSLLDSGVVKMNEKGKIYDLFKNRIMWPFLDHRGQVIGFTGRDISKDAQVKYLNTPETQLFVKGSVLFGMYQARQEIVRQDRCYLVEGQFDVMRLASLGVQNVVCGSGTAFTEKQAQILRRQTDTVTLIYDADEAGVKATRKTAEILLRNGFFVSAVLLPAGNDPDDYFRGKTQKFIQKELSKETSIVDYLYTTRVKDSTESNVKASVIDDICNLLSYIDNKIYRGELVRDLCSVSKHNIDDIKSCIAVHLQERKRKAPDIKNNQCGILGLEELREICGNEKKEVYICFSEDDYLERWANTPSVLIKNVPEYAQMEELRGISSSVRTSVNICIDPHADIPYELTTLKNLARAGFQIVVERIEQETYYEYENDQRVSKSRAILTELGWTQFYVLVYSQLRDQSELIRKSMLESCAEEISYADPTTYTSNIKKYASMLGVGKGDFEKIIEPYRQKRKVEAKILRANLEDEDGSIIHVNPNEIPVYVEEDEELNRINSKYGFYPLMNRNQDRPVAYMFNNGKGSYIQVANFYMKPLIHILSDDAENNRRIVEITCLDRKGKIYMDFVSKDLISKNTFEQRLWDRGNLCFINGKQEHLDQIRYYMGNHFLPCTELLIYGWNDKGFFAFPNGIYHSVEGGKNEFEHINDIGVVQHDGERYYMPTFSKLNIDPNREDQDRDRFLQYKDNSKNGITFERWTWLMDNVYKANNNGKWAILYAIMCAFRSDIFEHKHLFTSLFFVGPTNSGKSKIATSVRGLYMPEKAPCLNLNMTSIPALSTSLERYRNIPVILEEYNDDLATQNPMLLQILKASVYDGEGRQKMGGTMAKEVKTYKVNAPIVLLGQEAPASDDGSLANRCIICDVPLKSKGGWSDEESRIFNELKDAENDGLHHLLLDVLSIRPLIKQHYPDVQTQCFKDLSAAVSGKVVNSEALPRILNTVSIFLAVCKIIKTYTTLDIQFGYEDFFSLAVEKVLKQVESISNSNKVTAFFNSLLVMLNKGLITPGKQYKIDEPRGGQITVAATGKTTEIKQIPDGHEVLYLQVRAVYPDYQKLDGRNALSQHSLQTYFESTDFYIGRVNATRFEWMEAADKTRFEVFGSMRPADIHADVKDWMNQPSIEDRTVIRSMEKKTCNTSCMAFDYTMMKEMLMIDLKRDSADEDSNN